MCELKQQIPYTLSHVVGLKTLSMAVLASFLLQQQIHAAESQLVKTQAEIAHNRIPAAAAAISPTAAPPREAVPSLATLPYLRQITTATNYSTVAPMLPTPTQRLSTMPCH
ncbi:hypothetical protein F3Y22_tig00110318pilonHSYRG00095 [Hibiscus syriacus]|uniref:Uncharacterized protein n=1 Tax=Hibiscus syriacus TaxID=106335 RepID=A0A6A3B4Y0_HIBSY|nr:hypothetical protein F3Y22_tig00110318pilonHSYRG00095 [Hibiscus syriacus]